MEDNDDDVREDGYLLAALVDDGVLVVGVLIQEPGLEVALVLVLGGLGGLPHVRDRLVLLEVREQVHLEIDLTFRDQGSGSDSEIRDQATKDMDQDQKQISGIRRQRSWINIKVLTQEQE